MGTQTGRTMKLARGLLNSITDKGSKRTYNFLPTSRLSAQSIACLLGDIKSDARGIDG